MAEEIEAQSQTIHDSSGNTIAEQLEETEKQSHKIDRKKRSAWQEAAWIFVLSRLVIVLLSYIGTDMFPRNGETSAHNCAAVEKHRHTIVPLISILVYSPGIIGMQYPTSISPIMVTGSPEILFSSLSGLCLSTALELHLARLPLPIILQVSFFQIYASTSCLSSSTTCSTMILGHR